MINIAICDDEQLICTQLNNIILNYLEKRQLSACIKTYSSCECLLQEFKEYNFACIFLDIDFKQRMSGINAAKQIRLQKNKVQIIFISSYPEYMNQTFSIHTFDFITKPYKNQEVYRILDDLFYWLIDENVRTLNKMQFKTIDGIISLDLANILYFEYKNRRIDIITEKTTYHMYGKIRDLSIRLKDYNYAVPHISYIVNLEHIKLISKANGTIIMTNNYNIPISQFKAKTFREKYLFFLEQKGEVFK